MARLDTLPAFPNRRRIGEGGIADVFQATHEGRPVALKVLRETDRTALRKRFLREGRLLRRLSHPGLPGCLAVLDTEPAVLILELLVGEPLDRRLARGPVSPAEAEHLAGALLDVLAYLHEHGIVHRDVKTSNIWLAPEGRVVLMDLGLAADAADPLTSTLGEVVGTHAYMAPEQIAGAESDHRCDLYSLGVTLYEALCGARPYQARGLAGYLQAHRSGLAVPLRQRVPGLPARLVTLVDRLMAGDPAARPTTARVARAMLTGGMPAPRGVNPPRLVGREGTRGAILAVLHAGGVLRVSGEIGSGAGAITRLATELARGEGTEYAVLRARPRLHVADVISQLAAALDRLCGPVTGDGAGVRAAMEAMIAESGRFLVVVEDLDLAPPPVVRWVADLAGVSGIAILVTGVALPPDPPGREHRLRPLLLAETRELLAGMLGTTAVPPGLDLALHRSCGGQPALIVATLREQADEGIVWRDGAEGAGEPRWTWDANRRLRPSRVGGAELQRFVAALPARVRDVLAVLGVAGAPLPLEVALAAAGADPSGVELGTAQRTGLLRIERVGDEEWLSARRVLVDPLVVEPLPEAERARRHAAIAGAAPLHGDPDWVSRAVALHSALAAGGSGPALLDLADDLLARGQPGEALALVDASGRLGEWEVPAAMRRAALRCEALVAVGRSTEARDALRAARALAAEGCGDADPLVLADADWQLHVGHAFSDVTAAALTGLARLQPRARVLLAIWHLRRGDTTDAADRLAEAFTDVAGDERTRLDAGCALGHLLLDGGLPDDAADTWRRLLSGLRGLDRPIAATAARCGLAEVLRTQGHLALALETLRYAEAVVAGRDLPWSVAEIDLVRAGVERVAGVEAGLLDQLARLEACGHPGAPWPLRARYLDLLAQVRLDAGDSQAALAVHLRAADAGDAAGDVAVATFHQGMAAVLVADTASFGDALDRLGQVGRPGLLARVLAAGARYGRDPDGLTAAEVEARGAGDVGLLVEILHLSRGPGAREEAATLCERLLAGLYGPLRRRLGSQPAVRWAVGEP